MSVKFLTAQEAAELVPDGATLATDGCVGTLFAEEVAEAIEERFLRTGHPRDLSLVFCAGQGDFKQKGLNHFGHEGLIRRGIGGYWGLCPNVVQMVVEEKIEGYNFPQGVLAHILRDTAAGRPGTITTVGLGTYVDPRQQGGKLNSRTQEDLVEFIHLKGREYLFYHPIPLQFAILKGSYADEQGNISIQREGARMDMLVIAEACKNSGGTVVVQVEQLVEAGSLDPKNRNTWHLSRRRGGSPGSR